VVERGYTPR
jgi:NitT/TauT family transport system substrate-binding protein